MFIVRTGGSKSALKAAAKRVFSDKTSGNNEAKTALYDFHVQHGGKIVNFGGFLLPVQYSDQSIVNSHLFTRKSASLFDVSHMLQTDIQGKSSTKYLESVCTADLATLPNGTSVLTVFTNKQGGILDDLIITKIAEDHFYVVSNAARKDHDQKHLLRSLENHNQSESGQIHVKFFDPSEKSLLAIQGPKAAEILQKLTDHDLSKVYFMNSIGGNIGEVQNCRITRCGYTGEDGFELSVPSIKVAEIAEQLLKDPKLKLAGLGARDSLRLEAGLCLYGSDITSETTPIEAALTWLIAKRRRELADFPGADVILQQIKNGSKMKRIGLISYVGPPARHNAEIVSEDGQTPLGVVTSGCPSPTLQQNVAMGYVPMEFAKNGTKVNLKIRDKLYGAVVSKMPFVKSNYYNKPKI